MESKLDIQTVHTVQIDGKDVEVIVKEDLDKAFGSYQETSTAEVTKQVTEAEKSVKRELSKKFGVNMFDEKEIESFIAGDDKVARSEYDKVMGELEAFKPIKEKYSTIEQENRTLKFENAVIVNNVDEQHKDKVIKLANLEMSNNAEITPQQAVENIVKEFDMFKSKAPRVGRGFGDGPEGKTNSEKYIADKYKDNPYYNK